MVIRQFFNTHHNKLDAKNRISIPAGFRTVFRDIGAQKLLLRKSIKFPAIEAWPDVYFAEFEARLDSKDVFSDEHDDLAWDVYAGAQETEPDRDGRVILSPDQIAWAGLATDVAVVGLGKRFEFWDRAAANTRMEARMARRTPGQPEAGRPEPGRS